MRDQDIKKEVEIEQSKGYVEVHRVRINPEANMPQTWGLTTMAPVEVENPSQFEKEGNRDVSDSGLPQMTPTYTETESDEGSEAP